MYRQERIINGVLCWRGTPDGAWQPYTLEQITAKWQELRAQLTEAGLEPRN